MKSRNIGMGIFFIIVGAVWLLVNLGYIRGWWILNSLSVLWPLLLVVIGINIIFRGNAVINIIVWLLFAAAVIGYSFHTHQVGVFVKNSVGQIICV